MALVWRPSEETSINLPKASFHVIQLYSFRSPWENITTYLWEIFISIRKKFKQIKVYRREQMIVDTSTPIWQTNQIWQKSFFLQNCSGTNCTFSLLYRFKQHRSLGLWPVTATCQKLLMKTLLGKLSIN